MTAVAIRWQYADIEGLVDAGFDRQKVEYEVSPGVWTELTTTTTRPYLVTQAPQYVWHANQGTATSSYRITPINSTDLTEDTPITPIEVTLRGYCTVQEMRDEGYTLASYSDARVQAAIDMATAKIDSLCGWRFDAHYRVLKVDVDQGTHQCFLQVPIIALLRAYDYDAEVERSGLAVYNRHLTQGLLVPDDRFNPHLAMTEDFPSRLRMHEYYLTRFYRGQQQLELAGIFGYTDLGDAIPGETEINSQIPIDFGQTPLEISWACKRLASYHLNTLAAQGQNPEFDPARLKSVTTRDQSFDLNSTNTKDAAYASLTGWEDVDQVLYRYIAPSGVGYL